MGEMKLGSKARLALWSAIDRYVRECEVDKIDDAVEQVEAEVEAICVDAIRASRKRKPRRNTLQLSWSSSEGYHAIVKAKNGRVMGWTDWFKTKEPAIKAGYKLAEELGYPVEAK